MDNKKVLLLIERLMNEHGLTREQLSEAIGYRPGTLTSLISKKVSLEGAARKLQRAIDTGTLQKTKGWPQTELIPYYDISTTDATLEQLLGTSKEAIKDTVKVPFLKDVQSYINVAGDFMYDNGDIIGVKFVEIEFLKVGLVYLLITTIGNVFGQIRQGKTKNQLLIYPKDVSLYDPISINTNDIKHLFVVVGRIKRVLF